MLTFLASLCARGTCGVSVVRMGREGARDTLQPDKRAEAGSARGEPFSTLIGWERLTGDAERALGCTFTSCVTISQLEGEKKSHAITCVL